MREEEMYIYLYVHNVCIYRTHEIHLHIHINSHVSIASVFNCSFKTVCMYMYVCIVGNHSQEMSSVAERFVSLDDEKSELHTLVCIHAPTNLCALTRTLYYPYAFLVHSRICTLCICIYICMYDVLQRANTVGADALTAHPVARSVLISVIIILT